MPFATFSMPLLGRKNNFPCILSFSGWFNYHIDMRQINIKITNLICMYMQRFHKNMGAQGHIEQLRLTCPCGLREKEAAVWDFKGKTGNSQVYEKEQTNSCLVT